MEKEVEVEMTDKKQKCVRAIFAAQMFEENTDLKTLRGKTQIAVTE